jgi:hypothetical protein
MRITNFFGNLYIRRPDLPAAELEHRLFGFDLVHDDQNIASNYVTVREAPLPAVTASAVFQLMTQAIPVTSLISSSFRYRCDRQVNLLAANKRRRVH